MDSIYTLLSAMKGQQRQMDAVSNNLANVNTAGYKGDQVLFREFYSQFAGQDLESDEEKFAHNEFISPMSRGATSFVMPDHVSPSMERGTYKQTGNSFDVAIKSDGYYVVETPYGTRYTRNGKFMLDQEGYLITAAGDRVQGRKGDIPVKGNVFTVGDDGSVLVDGVDIDNIVVVTFEEETRLTKMGNSYWAPSSEKQKPKELETADLRQGVLEGSNVDSVQEMVKMIAVNRSYESAQKLMRNMDEIDEQVISIARV